MINILLVLILAGLSAILGNHVSDRDGDILIPITIAWVLTMVVIILRMSGIAT